MRKILARIGIVAALVITLRMQAMASETGTIRVQPTMLETHIYGGEVILYRVGDPTEDGYILTDGLANWRILEKDAYDPEFAQWIVSRLRVKGTAVPVEPERGAVFTDLTPGLYMITQEDPAPGYRIFNPFMLALKAGESKEAFPKAIPDPDLIPKTGSHKAPIVWAMLAIVSLGGALIVSENLSGKK